MGLSGGYLINEVCLREIGQCAVCLVRRERFVMCT